MRRRGPVVSAPDPRAAVVEYVVGFAIDTRDRVALIRKNRPAWQAGRLNGIGGHVEDGERPMDAMVREFLEEAGTTLSGWDEFVVMDFPGARIHFYRNAGLHPVRLDGLRSMTDEEIVVLHVDDIGIDGPIIPNLAWLVPLAAYTADTYAPLHVRAVMAEVVDASEHAALDATPPDPADPADGLSEERHPEDYCHRCGGPNISWYTPAEAWNPVMRPGGHDTTEWLWNEIICPLCFAELAAALWPQATWMLLPDERTIGGKAYRAAVEAARQRPTPQADRVTAAVEAVLAEVAQHRTRNANGVPWCEVCDTQVSAVHIPAALAAAHTDTPGDDT